jgi:Zn-dependent protease with chaperone function
MGERIRPDLGLQLCMAVALLLEAAVTVALAAGLVWVTLFVDRGYAVTFAVAIVALLGAVAATDTGRRRRHRGRDVTTRDRERVRRIAERLCAVGDIAAPRVAVRENPLSQSWTVAVPWGTPRIFVTTGLLDLLDDRRLEAVVAHELSHIAHHDALVMTIAALPGDWVLRGLRQTFRRERRDDPLRAYASIPVAVLLAIPAVRSRCSPACCRACASARRTRAPRGSRARPRPWRRRSSPCRSTSRSGGRSTCAPPRRRC